jgi:hypothetical protein
MLERYRDTLTRVRSDLRADMLRYLVERGLVPGDVPGDSFYDVLERARLCQADAVLCCLRLNTDRSLRLAERLVGKPILRCPPMLMRWQTPVRATRLGGDDRIVTRVRRPQAKERGRRRLLGAAMYDRLARARVGMSVTCLLGRGLRRKDLRIATKRGYLELSA